ncbi:hypothetical protein LQ567_24760 [Niabella pedocola]|uniref:Carboxypeptidase regulatory-like domain-containing protein n=1 Tax=Niabella pedocola TaxID=1752077 RepID=A0ABS8PYX6_9BACT|nr:hypothetical protein [Niabella pedocola]MCD2426019.1 hypothetical protein [Niabella pedocola]
MRALLVQKIGLLFGILLSGCYIYGQDTAALRMEVQKEPGTQIPNLTTMVIALQNTGAVYFTGLIQVETPEGFRSISGYMIGVEIPAGEKRFIPVKIQQQSMAKAGAATIRFQLLTNQRKVLLTRTIGESVAENNNMHLSVESPFVAVNNPNDSVSVKVLVTNMGNRSQPVTLVFKVPELTGQHNFFEQTGVINIQQDSVFVFRLLPAKVLLSRPQFTIEISGMRGAAKELFGHAAVTVQNVSATQRYYHVPGNMNDPFYQQNSITASYRTLGDGTGIYQLMGGLDVDLPAGYLAMKANAYKLNRQGLPVLNNTSVAYHLDHNEITIGNIAQSLETSLFGRGVQVSLSDKAGRNQFQAGFIDQNYNLIEGNAFLKNGYGFYAKGVLGASNPSKNLTGTYTFKEDPFEDTRSHIAGAALQQAFGSSWNVNLKLYGAQSEYLALQKEQASFAAETQYNGRIKALLLNGNYFYSSAYFPGNRRGVLQVQQSIQTRLKGERLLYANFMMANFAPKSYSYPIHLITNNERTDLGIQFPGNKRISWSIGAQQQYEKGNSYSSLTGSGANGNQQMQAYRLTESMNWSGSDSRHSVGINAENGLVQYPAQKKMQPQFKCTANYSFSGLQAMASYQYGSYFLAEYAAAMQGGAQPVNKRMLFSLSYGRALFHEKLSLNAGGSYAEDLLIGKTPSCFLNGKYAAGQRTVFYLNSSWYRYNGRVTYPLITGRGTLNLEAGITVNLARKAVSAGRKAQVQTQVYYDNNNNNIYDAGDTVARDYMIVMNNTSFRTDTEGKLYYRRVPFGEYKIQPATEKGWFTAGGVYQVNEFRTKLQIPLHKSGTVSGRITYNYDPKIVLDVDPRLGGISFTVTRNGELIQQRATDDNGEFMFFLPEGTYRISLNESSLPANTYCEKNSADIHITAGKLTVIPEFSIGVRVKKATIKRFRQ